LRGEYTHSLDAKGRLFIPAKFREELGFSFVVTKGLGECLAVYPMQEWISFEEKIKRLPTKKARQLQMFFIAAAQDCEIDGQGRVLISPKLREYAGLSKNVVIAGMTNYMEIWDEDKWNDMSLTPDDIADIMEESGI